MQRVTIETIQEIRAQIKERQTAKRFEHTLGVAYTAACMAFVNDIDPLKAELAGLLHDCAKCYSNAELIKMCKTAGIVLSDELLASPAVIHAIYGRYMAYNEFGIKDKDILNAIEFHTTGRPDMSLLEKIVFTADYIEPLRDKASNLDEARKLAFQNIDECVLNILHATVTYLDSKHSPIVSDTLSAYSWYSRLRKEQI